MLLTKSPAYILKNLFAVLTFLLVLVSVSVAQEKSAMKHDKAKMEKECKDMEMRECHNDSAKMESKKCCKGMTRKECKEHCKKGAKMGAKECPVKEGQKVGENAEGAKAWNAVCPVLGNKVDADVETVEYKGKAYGFCCQGCDRKFKANPEKYIRKLSNDGKMILN
ncbi:MAG: YHS domain-containing protein [Ignavibacteria bacterium]